MDLLSTTQLSLSNLSVDELEHGDRSPTSPMPGPLAGHLMFPHKYAVRVNKYAHSQLKRADTGTDITGNVVGNKSVLLLPLPRHRLSSKCTGKF